MFGSGTVCPLGNRGVDVHTIPRGQHQQPGEAGWMWQCLARSLPSSCKKGALTRTTGQMQDGSKMWSLSGPPSHSGFTWEAHLLWSWRGWEESMYGRGFQAMCEPLLGWGWLYGVHCRVHPGVHPILPLACILTVTWHQTQCRPVMP